MMREGMELPMFGDPLECDETELERLIIAGITKNADDDGEIR